MEFVELKQPIDEILKGRLQVERSQISAVCKQFGIIELGVFGSVLRDDFRVGGADPSDVDLLIEFEATQRISWQRWMDLQAALEQVFNRKVDVVRKHLLKNPYRRAEILKTNCVVYEQR